MKNWTKILGVALLTVIYFFGVSFASNSHLSSDYGTQETTDQEQYQTTFSTSLFCHTSQSENLVNSFNSIAFPNFKNPFSELSGTNKAIEHFFSVAFTQYDHFLIHFLIQHRKSEILYPFHYFW